MNDISKLDAAQLVAIRAHVKRLQRQQPDAAVSCPICSVRGLGRNLTRHFDEKHGRLLETLSLLDGATDFVQGIDHGRWITSLVITCVLGILTLMVGVQVLHAPSMGLMVAVGLPFLSSAAFTVACFFNRKTTLHLKDDHILVQRWLWEGRRHALPITSVEFSPMIGGLGDDPKNDRPSGLCLTVWFGEGSLQLSCPERSSEQFTYRWKRGLSHVSTSFRIWPTNFHLKPDAMLCFEAWLCRQGALSLPNPSPQLFAVIPVDESRAQGLD